jgi:[ribosomal protein S18]-alanine N-acetyltransferase
MTTIHATTDADLLARLHAAAFPEPWSAEWIASLLAQPGTFALVDGESAGFVFARTAGDEAEIISVAVSPAARRRGVGAALVSGAAAYAFQHGARTLFLEVGSANIAAKSLYERLGFRQVGRRRDYYKSPDGGKEDALVLSVELPPPWVGNRMQLD